MDEEVNRACAGCGLPLSRYNTGNVCQACTAESRTEIPPSAGAIVVNGRKMAELRRGRGWTQEFLADRIGFSLPTVQKLEQGNDRKSARISTLSVIARVLDVPLSELLTEPGTQAARKASGSHARADDHFCLPADFWAREEVSAAVTESDIPRFFGLLVYEKRWTQRRLAEIIGYSQGWVSNVMRRDQALTVKQAREILRRFGAPLDRLTLLPRKGATWPGADSSPHDGKITSEVTEVAQEVFTGIDDMNRRELLRIMTMVGAMTAAGSFSSAIDWERVGFTGQTGKADSSAIGDLAALNDHLWRVFVLSRTKQAVFPLVRDHLDLLVNTLSNAGSTDVYRRLCGCVSSAFQLCGEILFDGNLYTEAAHCYLLAATAGREAGVNDLWACALTRHAFIGLYERRFDKATPLLDLAKGLARDGDQTLATRHWIAAVQAQAFAGLGRLSECQRALEIAGRVHELDGDYHNGGWLRFDGSRLAEERGACYVQLKRFDLAASALTDALNQHLSPRRRGGVLVDLAILGIQQNDVDQMLTYAEAATQIIQQTGSGYVVRKLVTLQPYLRPFMGDLRIRNLDEQIAAFGAPATAG